MKKHASLFTQMKKIVILCFIFNCIAVIPLPAQLNPVWVKKIGGNYYDWAGCMHRDSAGNFYLTGSFVDTVDFDPGPGTAIHISDSASQTMFLAKYDPQGNFLWAKDFAAGTIGIGSGSGTSIITDHAGNIYLGGYWNYWMDFDPGPVNVYAFSGADGAFVAKYDSLGNYLWVVRLNAGCKRTENLLLDGDDNIIAQGIFSGTQDFDPDTSSAIITAASIDDIFVVKYDSSRNYIWAKDIDGGDVYYVNAAKMDAAGNIYLTGTFSSIGDFDPGTGVQMLYSNGSADAFFAKYDSACNYIWAKSVGCSDFDGSNFLTLTGQGDVLIAGSFNDTIIFNADTLIGNVYASETYFAKYDSAGNFKWAKKTTCPNGSSGRCIQTDAAGNIFLAGTFHGDSDFDPGPGVVKLYANSIGASNIYIAKYDSTGSYMWAKNFPGYFNSYPYIETDGTGNLYILGGYHNVIDFSLGAGTMIDTAFGQDDFFFGKYSQDNCSSAFISIDSISDYNCSLQQGLIATSAHNAIAPYTFVWNTLPVSNDSIVNILNPGIYVVALTDNSGCVLTRSSVINGPAYLSGFDLNSSAAVNGVIPGFSSTLSFNVFNDGCDTITGLFKLVLDTTLTYTGSTVIPDSVSGDTLYWNFSAFNYNSAHLSSTISYDVSPQVNVGDTVKISMILLPVPGDMDSSNNIKDYILPVYSSFDPNAKQVYPQGVGTPGYIKNNKTMTYTIQFQNTGTATAQNVNIIDTIDINLNFQSLKIIGSSHPVEIEVLSPNILRFRFQSINLPDSSNNEPASHGYLSYEIDQIPSLTQGSVMQNTAYIYFDFNIPVATNTVVNTIDLFTGIINPEIADQIDIFPNPVQANFIITLPDKIAEGTIEIYNVLGEKVFREKVFNESKKEISLRNISSGIYFVKVFDARTDEFPFGRGEKSYCKKIIVE